MAGETTVTSLNDLIHSQQIEELILAANRPASVHQLIAWARDASKGGAGVYQFPKWDKVDVPSGVKTEGTGSFTITEQTTSSATATAGFVGIGIELTDEAAQDSLKGLADMIMLNEARGAERVTKDCLSLFTSCTNTHAVGDAAFDLTQWGLAKAKFKALNPVGARLAYVGSNASIRDLEASMRATGASFMANPLIVDGKLINNPGQGYRGMFEGIEIYETSLCPDHDADIISTAFLVAGDQGAIGLAVWVPWRHEVQRNSANATDELYSAARYGVCLTNQSNILEVQSQD